MSLGREKVEAPLILRNEQGLSAQVPSGSGEEYWEEASGRRLPEVPMSLCCSVPTWRVGRVTSNYLRHNTDTLETAWAEPQRGKQPAPPFSKEEAQLWSLCLWWIMQSTGNTLTSSQHLCLQAQKSPQRELLNKEKQHQKLWPGPPSSWDVHRGVHSSRKPSFPECPCC